jgi:uncharacterized membrane protein YbhN (UPF0104 family)
MNLDKRKALIGVGVALVLTVAAVALLGQLTSYGELLDAWRRADKAWLPLCLLGELAAYLGYLVAYRSVAAADAGPKLPYRDAAQVISLGLGAYVLGSSAGGLTVDYWAMRRAGAPTHEAARRTLALNTLQAAGLTTLAALAGAIVLGLGASGGALALAIVWLTVVPAATAAAAVVSDDRVAPRLLDVPERGNRLWLKARKLFADTIGGVVVVRHVVTHPLRYLGGVLGYPLFWLGDFFILWVALVAFGVHLDPARLVLAEATAWVVSFVPLPAGGSGVAEATMAGMLNVMGVPLAQALPAAVVYRAVNFWLPLLPALALLPRARRLQRELEETSRASPDEDATLPAARRG